MSRAIEYLVALAISLCGCSGPESSPEPITGRFEVQGPVYEIGSSGADESQLYFGDATDAILLPGDSVLLVLDNIQKNLSLVSVSGERLFTVGRSGGGPEEFRHADGLALLGSTAWVLDRGNGRMALWELQGDTIAFERVIPLPLEPEKGGICVTANEAFLYGGRVGSPIHRFDHEGNHQASIGSLFGDERMEPVLRGASSSGPFRCDAAQDEILVSSRLLGVIRSHDRSGELRWERQIPTFARVEMSTTERGGYRFSTPSEPNEDGVADLLVTIWTVDGIVGVQEASDVRRNSDRDLVDVRTTILDRATGEVMHRTQELPHIKHVIGDWAVSLVNDPYPVIRLYRWTLE